MRISKEKARQIYDGETLVTHGIGQDLVRDLLESRASRDEMQRQLDDARVQLHRAREEGAILALEAAAQQADAREAQGRLDSELATGGPVAQAANWVQANAAAEVAAAIRSLDPRAIAAHGSPPRIQLIKP